MVLCGLVSALAPLPLTGADGLAYALEPVAFVAKAAPFSFVLYVLVAGVLVLCGLVSPFAPLPLRGAGGQAFSHKNIAFHWKTAASYGNRDTVWQG